MAAAMKAFFSSYTRKDRKWAEWIARQLEEAAFSANLFPAASLHVRLAPSASEIVDGHQSDTLSSA